MPTGFAFFGNSTTSFFSNTTFIFFIYGIIVWIQNAYAIKKINNNEYQVFKTICKKVSSFGANALVQNNEILSKQVKRPLKMIWLLESARSIRADEEIGILQVNKEFRVFSLNT